MLFYQGSILFLMVVYPVFGTGCYDSRKGEKKFKAYKEQLNWFAAMLNCSSQGMTLATIESQEDQDRITNELKKDDYNHPDHGYWWLGGADLHETGNYIWFTTGEPITYTKYREGQPDNYYDIPDRKTEHCLEIVLYDNNEYEWNDHFCDEVSSFVCEYFES